MRKLISFTQITLDGFFANADGGLDWAHKPATDTEFNAFVADNAKGGGELLFGRVTYQLLESFWPTPAAKQMDPVVAERMNALPKTVFSNTLDSASWTNTTLVKGDLLSAVRKLKAAEGKDLAILGSGSIVAQLAQARLIDEVQLVLNPLVIGNGKKLFTDVERGFSLALKRTRTFGNGCVLLCYEPVA